MYGIINYWGGGTPRWYNFYINILLKLVNQFWMLEGDIHTRNGGFISLVLYEELTQSLESRKYIQLLLAPLGRKGRTIRIRLVVREGRLIPWGRDLKKREGKHKER